MYVRALSSPSRIAEEDLYQISAREGQISARSSFFSRKMSRGVRLLAQIFGFAPTLLHSAQALSLRRYECGVSSVPPLESTCTHGGCACRASLAPCHEALLGAGIVETAGLGHLVASVRSGWAGRWGVRAVLCVSLSRHPVQNRFRDSKFLFGDPKSLEISFTLRGPQISKRISRDPWIRQVAGRLAGRHARRAPRSRSPKK